MNFYDQAQRLNHLANEAVSSGNLSLACKLKIQAAKKTLCCYEQTGDPRWIKVAGELFSEAKCLEKKLVSVTRKENGSWHVESGINDGKQVNFEVKPKVSLKDIGGLETSKELLLEAIEWPLKFPEKMAEYGLDYVLSGVLTYGPPGCGKTLLVEGVASDLNVRLLEASPNLLTSKWFGESEKFVKKLFDSAREKSPSMIFVDEIEKFLPQTTGSSVVPRILSCFQTEMDGLGTHRKGQLIVVMASNEPWKINHAILRPGRCDCIIYIPPPDKEARKAIFAIHSRTRRLGGDVNENTLAELTESKDGWYYSGSDIANICRTAKKHSMRIDLNGEGKQEVDMKSFVKALEVVHPSISPQDIQQFERWTERHASLKEQTLTQA